MVPFCARPDEAARRALDEDAAGGLNVYVGLHPRRAARGSGAMGVGTNEDVLGLAGLAVYIDLHGRGARFKTVEEALSVLEDRLPPHLQPPLVLLSGYGVWGLWPFRERLAGAEHARYLDLGKRLAALLASDPSIYDLRRIARMPGTRNWRERGRPLLARLHRCVEGQCFSLEGFGEWLPSLPEEPRRPRTPRATTTARSAPAPRTLPAPVLRVIDALALPVRPVVDPRTGGIVCVQILSECPACHASHERKAWLTPSGRLKCWRESCPAGIGATGMDSSGHARGLPLSTWVGTFAPGALPAVAVAAPAALAAERCADLAEAEARLPSLLEQAICWAEEQPGRVALVAATPGLGKTREALRALAERGGRGTLLAQAHVRLDERERESVAHGPKTRRRYHGLLSVVDEAGRPVCRYARALAPCAARGWSMRANACRTCVHRDNYDGSGETCRAYAGVTGRGTRFATHAHAASLGPTGDLVGPIIADELPALLQTVTLAADELVPLTAMHLDPALEAWAKARAPFARILLRAAREMREARRRRKEPGHAWRISGQNLRGLLGFAAMIERGGGSLLLFDAAKEGAEALDDAARRLTEAHDGAPRPPAPDPKSLRDGRIRAEHYPHHTIDEALIALAREGEPTTDKEPIACLVADGAGDGVEVRIEWRQLGFGTWKDKSGRPLSLVVLDASAPHVERSVQAALPEREVRMFRLDLADPDSVTRVFMRTTTLSRRNLIESRRPMRLRKRASPALARVLRRTGRRLAALGLEAQLGIITHAPIARILGDCVKVLDLADADARARLEEKDALGVLAELEALRASHRIGQLKVLWYGGQRGSNELEACDALLCLGDPWPDIGAGKEDARALGVEGAVHLDGLVGAEVLQALGRARAVRRTPERPVVLLYAGSVVPSAWANSAFSVELLGDGRLRTEASLDAEDLAHAMIDRWGAACPALVRLVISAPKAIEVLDHRPVSTIREISISREPSMLPPLDLGAIAGLSRETLREALERALGGLPEVTVPSPTAPVGAGGAWRLREARPGAAREISEALRAWLAAVVPVAPATETAAPAEAPILATLPALLVAPKLPPSPRCAPRPSRSAAYCALRAGRRTLVRRLASPSWYQQAASRYRHWHRGADGREERRPPWLRRSARPQPDPAATKVTGK